MHCREGGREELVDLTSCRLHTVWFTRDNGEIFEFDKQTETWNSQKMSQNFEMIPCSLSHKTILRVLPAPPPPHSSPVSGTTFAQRARQG